MCSKRDLEEVNEYLIVMLDLVTFLFVDVRYAKMKWILVSNTNMIVAYTSTLLLASCRFHRKKENKSRILEKKKPKKFDIFLEDKYSINTKKKVQKKFMLIKGFKNNNSSTVNFVDISINFI